MRDAYKLCNKVACARKLHHMTQTELAKAVGVSKNTISSIETGVKEPSIFIALAISQVLGVHIRTLFYLDFK